MTNTVPTKSTLTPESMMTGLRRQLEADAAQGTRSPWPDGAVDRVVTDTVESLWRDSRIKTYLPVLALRQARDTLRRLDDAPDSRP